MRAAPVVLMVIFTVGMMYLSDQRPRDRIWYDGPDGKMAPLTCGYPGDQWRPRYKIYSDGVRLLSCSEEFALRWWRP